MSKLSWQARAWTYLVLPRHDWIRQSEMENCVSQDTQLHDVIVVDRVVA